MCGRLQTSRCKRGGDRQRPGSKVKNAAVRDKREPPPTPESKRERERERELLQTHGPKRRMLSSRMRVRSGPTRLEKIA